MTITSGPLVVDENVIEICTDGRTRVAVFDQTPNRQLVGFMLRDDAHAYVRARNEQTGQGTPDPHSQKE